MQQGGGAKRLPIQHEPFFRKGPAQLLRQLRHGPAVGLQLFPGAGGLQQGMTDRICQVRMGTEPHPDREERLAVKVQAGDGGIVQALPAAQDGGDGSLVTHDGDVAFALPQAAEDPGGHAPADGLVALRALRHQAGVKLPGGIERREALPDLPEGEPVPHAHVLLLDAGHLPGGGAEGQGGLPGADQAAAEHRVQTLQLRHEGQQRSLEPAQASQGEIRSPAHAPALPDGEIRHGVADQPDLTAHNSSPKYSSNKAAASCRRRWA